jgi:hypothetical protein
MEAYCKHCRKTFEAKRASALYCSDSCKTLACRENKERRLAKEEHQRKWQLLEDEKLKKRQERKARKEAVLEKKRLSRLEKNDSISNIITGLRINAEEREKRELQCLSNVSDEIQPVSHISQPAYIPKGLTKYSTGSTNKLNIQGKTIKVGLRPLIVGTLVVGGALLLTSIFYKPDK